MTYSNPAPPALPATERLSSAASRVTPRRAMQFAALAALALGLSGCDGGGMMMGGVSTPASFQSNGERIYFTATSESGDPIRGTGGSMHMEMMGGGCATCHGADREGSRLFPTFWVKAPALTREALFEGHDDGDGEAHGDHAGYDAESLRRAVFEGIDPAGEPLDSRMPRWSMSERDWQDLLAYLRS